MKGKHQDCRPISELTEGKIPPTGLHPRLVKNLLDKPETDNAFRTQFHSHRAVLVKYSTLTQQEIADRVGATREMVNHVIRDLVQGSFLSRDQDRQMVVLKKLPRKW